MEPVFRYWFDHVPDNAGAQVRAFAAGAAPNGEGVAHWPPTRIPDEPYLRLASPVSTGAGIRDAQCDFWDSLAAALVPSL